MHDMPTEPTAQARAALNEIVAEHGAGVLSMPTMIASVLGDLLPDSPSIARILVVAAEERLADALREHTSQGMDVATAAALCASSFAAATMFSPDVCAWVTGELALAVGLITDGEAPATLVVPPLPDVPSSRPELTLGRGAAQASPETAGGSEPVPDAPARAVPQASGASATAEHGQRQRRRPGRRGSVIASATALLAAAAIAVVILLGGGTPGTHSALAAQTAYIVVRGNGTVVPIHLATGKLGTPIKVGPPYQLSAIAITPDGKTAYVTGAGTVTPINLATGTTGPAINPGTDTTGYGADCIAITPDGKTAYVTRIDQDTVVPVNLATRAVGGAINVGVAQGGIAITPDGNTGYVSTEYHVSTGSGLIPIDLAAGTPRPTIGLTRPGPVAFTPDGKTAYVGQQGILMGGGNYLADVIPINLATDKPGAPIRIGSSSDQYVVSIAITPDGKTVYVLYGSQTGATADTVVPISVATGKPGAPIKVGFDTIEIVLGP